RDVDARDRHQRQTRVVHPLELVGQHFAHHLVHTGGARVLAGRRVGPPHAPLPLSAAPPPGRSGPRVPSPSKCTTSTSSTWTSGARATNRSTSSSTSRRWPSL